MIFRLLEGFQKHHKNCIPRNLKSTKGFEAVTDEDNAVIVKEHYQEVFNRRAEVDLTILEEIPHHPTQEQLGNTSTNLGIRNAI
jgi:hypothetical protein